MASNKVVINGQEIGSGRPPYVIAEMSANHNGDLGKALHLIDVAAESGADAVKIQTYTADTITIDCDNPEFILSSGLWKGRKLYDLYNEAHTPWEWHPALFEKAQQLGITLFSSPFDFTAVDFLESLGAPAYKIASFELVDIPLLKKVALTGKPIIMSTGIASFEEISEAVSTVRSFGCKELILLHCVSGYPASASEINLKTIQHLAKAFDAVVGLSDHTLDLGVSVAACALGASVIEKHFTLNRQDGGPDSAFSLEPIELKALIRNCHLASEAIGSVDYGIKPSEEHTRQGRRSLYAVKDIEKGELLTSENIKSIRPGLGLPPKWFDQVIGKKASKDIKFGTPISGELFE